MSQPTPLYNAADEEPGDEAWDRMSYTSSEDDLATPEAAPAAAETAPRQNIRHFNQVPPLSCANSVSTP